MGSRKGESWRLGALTSFSVSRVSFPLSLSAVCRWQITVRGSPRCARSHKSTRSTKIDREKEAGALQTARNNTCPNSSTLFSVSGTHRWKLSRITTPERVGTPGRRFSFHRRPTACLMTGLSLRTRRCHNRGDDRGPPVTGNSLPRGNLARSNTEKAFTAGQQRQSIARAELTRRGARARNLSSPRGRRGERAREPGDETKGGARNPKQPAARRAVQVGAASVGRARMMLTPLKRTAVCSLSDGAPCTLKWRRVRRNEGALAGARGSKYNKPPIFFPPGRARNADSFSTRAFPLGA